jgi:hypothetical protein
MMPAKLRRMFFDCGKQNAACLGAILGVILGKILGAVAASGVLSFEPNILRGH